MSTVKLELNQKAIPQIFQSVDSITTKMTGNANFVTPVPTLASVNTLNVNMKLAYQTALDGGKGLKKLQGIARKNLLVAMSQLMAYVQFITGGDTAKILSSGMGTRKSRTPAILPVMVINLKAFTGDVIGTATMLWKAQDKVKCYEVQFTASPDPNSGWTHAGVSSKSRYTAEALPANTQVWLRVAAVNSAGQGGFSEPVQVFIKP